MVDCCLHISLLQEVASHPRRFPRSHSRKNVYCVHLSLEKLEGRGVKAMNTRKIETQALAMVSRRSDSKKLYQHWEVVSLDCYSHSLDLHAGLSSNTVCPE